MCPINGLVCEISHWSAIDLAKLLSVPESAILTGTVRPAKFDRRKDDGQARSGHSRSQPEQVLKGLARHYGKGGDGPQVTLEV